MSPAVWYTPSTTHLVSSDPATAMPGPSALPSFWVGCYASSPGAPNIENLAVNIGTTHACEDKCRSGGYQHMLLRDSGWCSCRDLLPAPNLFQAVPEEQCGPVCNGEAATWPLRRCGGESAYAVYELPVKSDAHAVHPAYMAKYVMLRPAAQEREAKLATASEAVSARHMAPELYMAGIAGCLLTSLAALAALSRRLCSDAVREDEFSAWSRLAMVDAELQDEPRLGRQE